MHRTDFDEIKSVGKPFGVTFPTDPISSKSVRYIETYGPLQKIFFQLLKIPRVLKMPHVCVLRIARTELSVRARRGSRHLSKGNMVFQMVHHFITTQI